MIRSAEFADLPRIVEMGERFHHASGYRDLVAFNADSFERTAGHLIESDDGILLIAESGGVVGMAGALLYPFYFNAAHKTGQEVFWWMEPEHRSGFLGLRLLSELEIRAKACGALTFSMVCLPALKPVAHVYRRRGYGESERAFVKRL